MRNNNFLQLPFLAEETCDCICHGRSGTVRWHHLTRLLDAHNQMGSAPLGSALLSSKCSFDPEDHVQSYKKYLWEEWHCVTEVIDMGTYNPLTCSLKFRGASGHLHSYFGWDFFLAKVEFFFDFFFEVGIHWKDIYRWSLTISVSFFAFSMYDEAIQTKEKKSK